MQLMRFLLSYLLCPKDDLSLSNVIQILGAHLFNLASHRFLVPQMNSMIRT